jgi:hypothetical protein
MPIRGTKPSKHYAISEDLNQPSSGFSSSFFVNPDESDGNPLYAPDSRLAQVRRVADGIKHRRGTANDLYEAIHLTFDKTRLSQIFPVRMVEVLPLPAVAAHRH